MKKILSAAIMTGLISGAAFAQTTVSSANIVGYVQKNLIPEQYLLVGVNFTSNGENPTLKEIVGTNQLRAASNPIFADRVVVFDTAAAKYQAYAQYDGDMEFYPCNTIQEWNTASATNPVIPVGSAFWIRPASGATTTNTLYFSGDVVMDEQKDISLVDGYQLVSWPFSADQDIATISVSNLTQNVNPVFADRIVVWEGDHYQRYGLYTDGNWYPCNTIQEWNDAIEETTRKITLGEGFWVISQGAKTVTEQNPYFDNLQ
jgi:hypothetical protein